MVLIFFVTYLLDTNETAVDRVVQWTVLVREA